MRYPGIAVVGLAQVTGIGSLFYAFPSLSASMADEFGYPLSTLLGCLTLTVLLGALPAPFIGRWVDRRGGHMPIILGSLLGVAALVMLGLSSDPVTMTIALLGVQIASGLTLYEAMFPALMQIEPVRARSVIMEVSLFGGLSSTIFWPLTQWLGEQYGWRDTLFILAAFNLAVSTPIYIVALRNAKPISTRHTTASTDLVAITSQRRTMIYLTVAICLISFPQQAVNYDFVPALMAHGLDAGTVAWIGALLGPSTVVARLLDITWGKRFSVMAGAAASVSLMTVALLIPAVTPAGSILGLCAFTVLFGIGQGIFIIARGTIPLAVFGPVAMPPAWESSMRIAAILSRCRRFFLRGQSRPQG